MIAAPDLCAWFALCDRPSVALVSHPANRAGFTVCGPCLVKLDGLSDGKVRDEILAYRTDAVLSPEVAAILAV